MNAIVFDTLAYAKKLKSAGFTEEQAEVQAEALAGLVNEQLATKRDLQELEIHLKHDLACLKHDLTIRLGGMMISGIAIVATLVKIL